MSPFLRSVIAPHPARCSREAAESGGHARGGSGGAGVAGVAGNRLVSQA